MAPYHGVYITHMRSEADRLLEAIDEAITIGREGGVPVEIYHLKAAGERNWRKAAQAIAKIDSARAAGQDVAADMYPYTAGGTALSACLPPWASADGKLLAPTSPTRRRGRRSGRRCSERTTDGRISASSPRPSGVHRGRLQASRRTRSSRASAWPRSRGRGTGLGRRADRPHAGGEGAARRRVLSDVARTTSSCRSAQPWIKFGTDAGGADPATRQGARPIPRAYGTYPAHPGPLRARARRCITLEDAVRKMTSAVAERLSIRDRGLLREGMYADVVVFDPATVIDHATFEQSHQLSTGIRDVFVNGVAGGAGRYAHRRQAGARWCAARAGPGVADSALALQPEPMLPILGLQSFRRLARRVRRDVPARAPRQQEHRARRSRASPGPTRD